MSVWLLAAIALCVGMVPCALVGIRGGLAGAVIALEVAGMVAALALEILSVHFQRQGFADLALVLVVLSFGGALAFLHYLERHR